MLNDKDRNYMEEVLATELGAAGSPRQELVAAFYNTTFATDLVGDNPRVLAIEAIRLCMRDAWNHDPTWLEMIINTFNLTTIHPEVVDILVRVRNKPVAAPDPLESNILVNGLPFVNRVGLRKKIKNLTGPTTNTQPILVVNGAVKSGKSYSRNFIDHYSSFSQSILVYKYEFSEELGLEIGPERVASDLVAKMARPLDKRPPLETNLKLYSGQLALWVLNEAAQTPAQHWFVLDNFCGDKLRPDTRDFILALTDNVTTGMFQRRCRIILIGFDSTMLTVDPSQYDEEDVQPCKQEDVKKVIADIVSCSPAGLDPGFADSFIFDNLPSSSQKMPELNARLRSLYLAITSLKEILDSLPGVNFQEVLKNILSNLPQDKQKLPELKKRLRTLNESKDEMPRP